MGIVVEAWLADVTEVREDALDLQVLDAAERERADAFLRPADRVRYLAAHVLLRHLLGGRTGRAPREVRFARLACAGCGGPHGRPVLDDPCTGVHFSLSHGGRLVMAGLAGVPLGVDVEPCPEPGTVDRLSRLLHPAEQHDLAAVPAPRRPAALARLWTRKEAYLKALGTGLTRGLAADYTGETGRAPAPPGWTITGVDAAPGHAAAVCYAHDRPARLLLRRAEHLIGPP
ncbi:4-phosphopantetheinyl transferase [Streptomyces sp. Ru62]|uniref:4'-phosphopantetheinyl transferase family protein n=1 Tax=Streptomyces sp. Ru62 TaxID=2080745 RepID=UPI000CDE2947|nr:4'-phosphopantetheinyl transferase superfamily protein [Streptomyces sp. Ru62]POX64486.1 4-phosphopantetheinyl transferase [Streptomyces sp. Ru62]